MFRDFAFRVVFGSKSTHISLSYENCITNAIFIHFLPYYRISLILIACVNRGTLIFKPLKWISCHIEESFWVIISWRKEPRTELTDIKSKEIKLLCKPWKLFRLYLSALFWTLLSRKAWINIAGLAFFQNCIICPISSFWIYCHVSKERSLTISDF